MLIISFFTEQGLPKSGLSPTIDVVDIEADTLIVNSAGMTALTDMTHGYYYDFTTYDKTKKYAITVDGGAVLNNIDRYQFATNEEDSGVVDIAVLKKIAINRWKVDEDNKQLIFYDDDNTTPLYTFDLKDKDGNSATRNIFERVPV